MSGFETAASLCWLDDPLFGQTSEAPFTPTTPVLAVVDLRDRQASLLGSLESALRPTTDPEQLKRITGVVAEEIVRGRMPVHDGS